LDSIADSRAFWSTIRKLNGNSFVKSMGVNADVLGKHFRDLPAPPDWTLSLHFAMPWIKNHSLDGCVTGLEVENVLSMLKERKAPGPDRIPSEFINYLTPQFKASHCFQRVLGLGNSPKELSKSYNFSHL